MWVLQILKVSSMWEVCCLKDKFTDFYVCPKTIVRCPNVHTRAVTITSLLSGGTNETGGMISASQTSLSVHMSTWLSWKTVNPSFKEQSLCLHVPLLDKIVGSQTFQLSHNLCLSLRHIFLQSAVCGWIVAWHFRESPATETKIILRGAEFVSLCEMKMLSLSP